MDAFEFADLAEIRNQRGQLYYEFLRKSSLSMGLYFLAAGSTDPQQPHLEDEVYYIINGRGHIQVDGEDQAVQPGSIVFVGRHVPHYFHSITEDLEILVFFAPPESS